MPTLMELGPLTASALKEFNSIKGKTIESKVACKSNLLALKSVLDAFGVKFYLVFGTLLGAIREGNFISGDHDTDIAILEVDEARLVEVLQSASFKNTGLRIIRLVPDLVSISKDGEYIDIYVFRTGGNELGSCGMYRLSQKQLDKPSTISFLGQNFMTVSDPPAYLQERYGNWKIPARRFAPF